MALDPMTLSLALSGVSAGAKALQGLKQKRAAKGIQVGKRQIDPATQKAIQNIQTRATSGKYAGQDIEEEMQQQDIANILEKAKEGGSPAAYHQALGQAMRETSANRRMSQLKALQDTKERRGEADRALMMLGDKRQAIADAEISEAAAQKQALNEASAQNVMGAVDTALGAAASYYGAKKEGQTGGNDKSASGGDVGTGEDNSLVQDKSATEPTKQQPVDVTTKAGPMSAMDEDNDSAYQEYLRKNAGGPVLDYQNWLKGRKKKPAKIDYSQPGSPDEYLGEKGR